MKDDLCGSELNERRGSQIPAHLIPGHLYYFKQGVGGVHLGLAETPVSSPQKDPA